MLAISKNYFEYLNDHEVRYCHWKSNEHLMEALSGKTDLDILVHSDDKAAFEEAFKVFHFKEIISPPEKQFPGMKDFLGFDYETGSLIHVHVHYLLVLGQKYIKNHHLPIEPLIFDNLIMKNGVKIPCPEIELLLITIRANVKVDMLSLIKHAIKDIISPGYTAYPTAIEEEIEALILRSDLDKMKTLLIASGLPLREGLFLEFIQRCSEKRLKFFHILSSQIEILRSLKRFRRNRGIFVYYSYAIPYIKELPIIRGFVHHKRKILDGDGKIISFVGADGSGKSTLIKDLEKWLSWKLSASSYYYGIPKNSITRLSSYLGRGFTKFRLNFLSSFVNELLWVYVARTRYLVSLSSSRDIRKGKVVITDRFPMKEFKGMPEPMDNPRLGNCNKGFGKYLSNIELGYYEKIMLPDCIFVLQVDLDELRKRKQDLSLEAHKIKADMVNGIEKSKNIVLINANKDYFDVQLQIKRKIWEIL